MEQEKGIKPDSIEINEITVKIIISFFDWLQIKRNNSIITRNQRHAAMNSFIKYMMYEFPEYLIEFQKILEIPIKKYHHKEISYLKTEGVKLLFDQIDVNIREGLRDYAILTFFYTTGIRVSELINIKVKNISLHYPPTLIVHGKGQRSRYIPLLKRTVEILQNYITTYNLDKENSLNDWLFKNHMRQQFTRQGINYIVQKYANLARIENKELVPKDLSPHKIRHTTAMELVNSGVDLIYIRDLLGHVSVKSTEIYAKADSSKKREAIEAASKDIVKKEKAQWEKNFKLKEWLKGFNRR